jgi:transcription elongation factor GreA
MRQIRDKYEKEIAELKRELTIELPKEIQRAVALGDLSENAEYTAALDRQRFVQARISQITQKLSQLTSMRITQIPRGHVGYGSVVTVRDLATEEELTFELVLPDEGEASQGQISISSPIGRALSNKEVGEEVMVQTPGGRREFEIIDLVTIHDREDGPGRAETSEAASDE